MGLGVRVYGLRAFGSRVTCMIEIKAGFHPLSTLSLAM